MKARPAVCGETSRMFTVPESGMSGGVMFVQFSPASREMWTRPSSVPAQSTPGMCFDSASAKMVQ